MARWSIECLRHNETEISGYGGKTQSQHTRNLRCYLSCLQPSLETLTPWAVRCWCGPGWADLRGATSLLRVAGWTRGAAPDRYFAGARCSILIKFNYYHFYPGRNPLKHSLPLLGTKRDKFLPILLREKYTFKKALHTGGSYMLHAHVHVPSVPCIFWERDGLWWIDPCLKALISFP